MTNAPPYTLTDEIVTRTASISEKVGALDAPSQTPVAPYLRRVNRIRSIHSSVAIEGNSLSEETVSALLEGKRVVGPRREILEVCQAHAAYARIDSFDPFSQVDLLKLHGILMHELTEDAGAYRLRNEGVFLRNEGVFRGSECIFMAPPPHLVPRLMDDLFSWLNYAKGNIHPLIYSSVFHYELVFIHPFADGNGRMSRLWHTALLADWRSVFAFTPLESQLSACQDDYYKAISDAHSAGESTPFLSFMLEMIERAVDAASLQRRVAPAPPRVRKLLAAMDPGVAYAAADLLSALGLKSCETLRRHYLAPAIELGLVRLAVPDKPTSRNQAYLRAEIPGQ